MQTYLKTKPVWIQLLQFLAFVFGSFFIIGFIGLVLSSLISGVPLLEAQNIATSKEPLSSKLLFMRGMLVTQFLAFIIPVFIFAKLSDKNPSAYLGLRAPQNSAYWIIAIVILFVALP